MSDAVNISILFDTTDPEAKLAALQAAIDRQQEEWRQAHRAILADMRTIASGINMLFSYIRLGARFLGEALDPIFTSLMMVLSSVVSLMVATAALEIGSGIPPIQAAGIALLALTVGYNIVQTAKLIDARFKAEAKLRALGLKRYPDPHKMGGMSGGAYL